ncbi:MAG TPA: (d)CMP kinase [Candidatus Binatia bacterium]|nr:(d)CMP kinase [Candidatus Binatia bacterium]
MKRIIVAIDGPAGAGKSTVAKRLAKELGYTYMDTGAMYRAFALKARRDGIDLESEGTLRAALAGTDVELLEKDGQQKVLLDGEDVTRDIRTPDMSQSASKISALKPVRERMVELQRALGARGGVVAEGRDIGTVVFPNAEVKVFLTAGPEERGRRRFEELKAQGKDVTLEETIGEMQQRDRRDQERAVAPLRQADDAVAVDSTGMGVDQVVERIMKEIKKKI